MEVVYNLDFHIGYFFIQEKLFPVFDHAGFFEQRAKSRRAACILYKLPSLKIY